MIYVITHKDFDSSILGDGYSVLHVGKSSTHNAYLRDDTLNNISYKNNSFCELTGIYWLWKNNTNNFEIIGIAHYRRYFTTNLADIMYTYFGVKPPILSFERMEKDLKTKDLILPKPERIFRTVRQYYADEHVAEDLDIIREIIQDIYPDYVDAFDRTMNEHYYYYANMMVCKKELFDAYCEWLFDILFEAENRIDLNKYENNYQRRVFGFLSERLLQVWVNKNGYSIKCYPAFNTETNRLNIFQKNFSRIRKVIRK